VTPNQFRRIALSLPEATEGAHMGHADFRVGGKIFATLGHPDASHGMVQLKPDQQALLLETSPDVFRPVPGGWGRQGSTHVRLAAADSVALRNALMLAWTNRAPKKLKAEYANAHPAPTNSARTKNIVRKNKKQPRDQ
jgi:hypothetical protein